MFQQLAGIPMGTTVFTRKEKRKKTGKPTQQSQALNRLEHLFDSFMFYSLPTE